MDNRSEEMMKLLSTLTESEKQILYGAMKMLAMEKGGRGNGED